MGVFRRGKIYWYEFEFRGQRVRESSHTSNQEIARSIERNRRRAMEESAGGVKRAKPILFRKAADAYFAESAHWSDAYREINTLKLSHLLPTFGKLLLTDITPGIIGQVSTRSSPGRSLGTGNQHGDGNTSDDSPEASLVAPPRTGFPPIA